MTRILAQFFEINLFLPHKDITTGDLRITENKKLRKLLTKGLNYRERRSINFREAYFEIYQALEAPIEKMSTRNKLDTSTVAPWREFILTIVKEKGKKLK